MASLIERRVVVIAGDVRQIVSLGPTGTAHKAEAGAAVKHVDVDRGLVVEDVAEIGYLRFGRAGLVRMSPVIEPAGPVFRGEEWLTGPLFSECRETAFRAAGAEVHS